MAAFGNNRSVLTLLTDRRDVPQETAPKDCILNILADGAVGVTIVYIYLSDCGWFS